MAPVVHEMRNFLTPMRLSIDLLRDRVAGDERGEGAVALLRSQAEGLNRMVGDLLDAARIATGKLELRLQDCVLQDVARAAVDMCGPCALERSQQLVLDGADAPVHVVADPLRLCQALVNLICNAVRYTPDGGRIRVEARAKGGSAILRVTDEGVGMAPELVRRAFELYVQGAEGADGGLGIGLYLVKSIAELHAGHVMAASDGPGRGCAFTITLPLPLSQASSIDSR